MTRTAGLLRPDDVEPEPWKNGRGVTRALIARDGWRLSVAEISRPAPFSALPGQDRTLMVSGANSLELTIDGRSDTFSADRPARFRGEDGVRADPPEGGIAVVNLMTRRELASHDVEVRHLDGRTTLRRTPAASLALEVHVLLRGVAELNGEELPVPSVLLSAKREHTLLCTDAVIATARVITSAYR